MIKHQNKRKHLVTCVTLPRLVESYFIVLRWYPVMLIAEDVCERWLGLCWYAEYRHRSSYPVGCSVCAVTDGTGGPLSWRTEIRGFNQQWQRVTVNLVYQNSHPENEC